MKSGKKTLTILLLVVALVLVNYLASALHLRLDLTAEKTYTLSPGTRSLLGKIEDPITLHFYFSRSLRNLPVRFKNYATRVEELLRQYSAASGGKVKLVITDPKPDTPEEESATRSRLAGQPLGDGTKLFFGLTATQADQEKAIAFFTPNREELLEYDLSQLLASVQQFDKPKLGLLSGLPLQPPAAPAMPGMPRQEGQVVAQEWAQTHALVDIAAGATELPAGLDALAIVHPQAVSEQLLYAIDQFVLSGKPVFIALDPSSRHFATQGSRMAMYGNQPQNLSSHLPRLLSAWGVSFDTQNVVGDLDLASTVQTQDGQASFPTWLTLGTENLASAFVPAGGIKTMVFADAGSFTVNSVDGLEALSVIQSSIHSGQVGAQMLQFAQPSDLARDLKPTGTKKILALLLRGTFKTAFPDGAPKPAELAKPDDKAAAPKSVAPNPSAPALAVSAKPGAVFLVGDTDWLLDSFSVRRMAFLGTNAVQPINDNLAFGTNVIDFLGGNSDLIAIRGKSSSQRPFEVIRRMEQAAQALYQERLAELEGRLQSVERRLGELMQGQKNQTLLVATPEMQAEIEKFRTQEAQMRSERRAIRQSLREGIERLQNTLILANLLSIPGVVALGGIWFFRRRGRRQRT